MANPIVLLTLATLAVIVVAPSAAAECPPSDYGEPQPWCGPITNPRPWLDCTAENTGAWVYEASRDCF